MTTQPEDLQHAPVVYFHPPQRDGDLDRVFAIVAGILLRIARSDGERLQSSHEQAHKEAA